jgi:uncharacterized membrane protein YbhN (UPF0104 family)
MEETDNRLTRRKSSKAWILWARILIAIMVVFGLAWTTRTAVGRWQQEMDSMHASIKAMDAQIAQISRDNDDEMARRTRTELIEQRERLAKTLPTISHIRWRYVAIASGFYSAGILLGGVVLQSSLRALGQPAGWLTTFAAQIIGHLGKYIPGKAAVVIMRVGILSNRGAAISDATLAVFIETFTLLAVGSAFGLTVVFTTDVPQWIRVAASILAIFATAFTLPPVMLLIARRCTGSASQVQSRQAWFMTLQNWVWTIGSWCLIGAAVWFVMASLPRAEPLGWSMQTYWIATSAIGLAFSLGFVSLLPGGAGVRELVLIVLWTPVIGSHHALAASILLRFVFLVVEVVLAGVAMIWLRNER